MNNGLLVILSAPSGCGKDTVFKSLKGIRDDVVESVSATTRAPREDEVDGVNYFFMSKDEFEDLINNDGLIEYANYGGNYYGTPVKGVNDAIKNDKICFLIIEVEGAKNVKRLYPDALSVFLLPPSIEVLEYRLHKRNTDNEEDIKKRLEIAINEISQKDTYDYQLINDDLDECVNNLNKIISDTLLKRNTK